MTMFAERYGAPAPGSAVTDLAERLAALPAGDRVLKACPAGFYDRGFLTIASAREAVPELFGWQAWLPKGAFLYASSAFGMLYVAVGEVMWLIDIQIGSIMQTDFALDEAILAAAEADVRNDLLNWPLFDSWARQHGALPPGHFLMPARSPITGIPLALQPLAPEPAGVALGRTADQFGPGGLAPVSFVDPD